MVKRQQVDHRPEPQPARPLRHRGEKHTGRGGVAERGRVVLGEMVAVKARAIVGLDQLQALLEQLAEGDPAVVQMIEDPKAHCLVSYAKGGYAAASIASAIFSAVIKVGKLVLAPGTTGNSDASTTRKPPTPRTRPWLSVTAIGSSS